MTGNSFHRSVNRSGFTLVELMTACVIVSIALLGIYVFFRDSIQMERRLTTGWQDRQTVETMIDQVCKALESAVEIPPLSAIVLGREADDRPFLECLTYADSSQTVLQRRRYRWDEETGIVDLRTILYSGSHPVSIQQTEEDKDPWDNVQPVIIGSGLKQPTIQFKQAASDEWKNQYSHSNAPVLVRLRAKIGDVTVERMILCPLSAPMSGGS